MTQHYAMLQRNLLYTGVTRGNRLVVLVGQKKAVAIAVQHLGQAAVVETGGGCIPARSGQPQCVQRPACEGCNEL